MHKRYIGSVTSIQLYVMELTVLTEYSLLKKGNYIIDWLKSFSSFATVAKSRVTFKVTTVWRACEYRTPTHVRRARCSCSHIALCACCGHQRLIESVGVRKAPVANELFFFLVKWTLLSQEAFLYVTCVSIQIAAEVPCPWNFELYRMKLKSLFKSEVKE